LPYGGGNYIYKYIRIREGGIKIPLPPPLHLFTGEKRKSKKMEVGVTVTEFFMPMKPPTITHQEKEVAVVNGKPVFYEPPELKAARAKLMAHLGQHVPDKAYTGPVRLTVKWCFLITGKHSDGEYKYTRPDNSNMQKLLEDCMEDLGFYKNDSQIASLIVEKFWAKLPGIYIKIDEV
jgi:Holliday junction resolvase RusA-like endonuclease